MADKPTKCTVPQSWQSKEDKKAWLFNQIEEYLEQFVSDASTLPDITEQVQRLEKMRRMDTDAEQQDVRALFFATASH